MFEDLLAVIGCHGAILYLNGSEEQEGKCRGSPLSPSAFLGERVRERGVNYFFEKLFSLISYD
jgi:hypothetical protein